MFEASSSGRGFGAIAKVLQACERVMNMGFEEPRNSVESMEYVISAHGPFEKLTATCKLSAHPNQADIAGLIAAPIE